MLPVDVFLLTFNRLGVFKTVYQALRDNTRHSINIHVFDNGSNGEMVKWLTDKQVWRREFASLHLQRDNTGPWYPKFVQHAMVEEVSRYYVVSDGDIEAPNLSPCWLARLMEIMDTHPDLGVLAAQVPPVWLQRPYAQDEEVVYCHAVGNTLKLVRREYVLRALAYLPQEKMRFGDDTALCASLHRLGYKVGYARSVFCHNLGQLTNWGYEPGEERLDPRKKDSPPPLYIKPIDMVTFESPLQHRYIPGVQYQHDAPS